MKHLLFLGFLFVWLTEGSTLPREKRNVCSPVNACAFQPCQNGGNCSRDENTCLYNCECKPHFTGEYCLTRLEPGESNNTDLSNITDLSNSTCETDDCVTSNPCYNGGTCVFDNSTCTATCLCTSNFTGDTCRETLPDSNPSPCIDFCKGRPCMNGGTCHQDAMCYLSCECPDEFTGDQCQYRVTSPPTGSTSPPPTTSLRPFSERSCGGGFTCIQGKCHRLKDGRSFCDCDPGYIDTFCHIPCALECGENGNCDRLNSTAPTFCNCHSGFTGPKCQDVIVEPSPHEWKYWILGCSLVLLVVLGGLCILIYILLKKRNIFIMRVKYYFQPFEDDDGKQFDAFISYKSAPEEEAFVYRTIYPELEVKRGYRLCLHHRDFRVGETIANNILWAIENSRRTILVLSPQYMQSDFTRFEYQEAHAEMLKMQHKVIPVLLEDVSEQKHLMDRTLSSILKSITYIEWPRDQSEENLKKFWTRLELSLPKKKPSTESSSSSSYPVLTFSNSSFDSQITDLDFISVEADGKDNNDGNDVSTDVKEDVKKSIYDVKDNDKIEPKLANNGDENALKSDVKDSDTKLTNRELKAFFKEPVDEEKFKQMKEKASEYENCLSTYL